MNIQIIYRYSLYKIRGIKENFIKFKVGAKVAPLTEL